VLELLIVAYFFYQDRLHLRKGLKKINSFVHEEIGCKINDKTLLFSAHDVRMT